MSKVTIFVHQHYLDNVIKKLHETGVMQIIHIGKKEPQLLEEIQPASMHPEASVLNTYELRLTRLIDILQKMKKKPSGVRSLLHPQLPEIHTIKTKTLSTLYTEIDTNLEEIEKNILQYNEQQEQLQEKETSVQHTIDQVEYLKTFPIALEDLKDSQYTTTKAGLTTDIKPLQDAIHQEKLITLFSQQFGVGKKTKWAVVLIGHRSEKEKIEQLTRTHLSELDLPELHGTPSAVINTLKQNLKETTSEKKKIHKRLEDFAQNHLSILLALREQTQLARAEKEVIHNFAKTDSTYVIQGWVVAQNVDELSKQISKNSNEYVSFDIQTPSANPDYPPTYIKTPWWAQGFRDLLEMFSTPKYTELNPTIIMGFFFILFFGFMLGDAGYGGLLVILSLIGFFKFGKHSSLLRNWSFMGIWMGATAFIVGILTYSIFGNFIHLFFFHNPPEPIYSFSFFGTTFPIDSLRDPLVILTAALILGLTQLNVGLALGMIQALKQKQYKELITKKFCWIPLQIGGGLLIGTFILGWEVTQVVFFISAALVVLGLVLLFISSGPVGFFNVTGFIGDWLSYARLLALGLATAGMALAFNVVSQLLGEMIPVIGIIVTILLLIILHLVNLVLSTLGAAVHSLRLQYVEFFNRFYEGGGTVFSPFKITRKYTQIKEKQLEE